MCHFSLTFCQTLPVTSRQVVGLFSEQFWGGGCKVFCPRSATPGRRIRRATPGMVMLLIPDRDQHTLGRMVAMGQLRRYGGSVCRRPAPTHDDLRSPMATRNFDGVPISVTKTIQFLRHVSPRPTPIIVGGAVMSKVEDPASCTGADLSPNDIGAALKAIGLKFDAFCVLKRAQPTAVPMAWVGGKYGEHGEQRF